MKAVIMAGGEGTRLRPLTSNTPKPMLPVVNRPMLEHVLRLLRRHGFTDVVVTVAFMANVIKTYFGDGAELGMSITYSDEPVPLGTAGSVRNAREHLDEPFLVISGDIVTDLDLSRLVALHHERGAVATIGLVRAPNPLEFGIVITREDGSIERFLEKPGWGQVFSDQINTGIYVLEPSVLDRIAPDRAVDFSSEVFPDLLARGEPLFGALGEGYWEDVGTLDAYLRVHHDVLDQHVDLDVDGFQVSEGVWLGEGAEVSPDATVVGPALLGPGCKVEAGSRLGEYVVLGSNVRVLANVELERVVLHDNVYVGSGTHLRGTVVGRSTNIRAHVRCDEGVVLGEEVYVGANAQLRDGVKVYPSKTIEDNAIVNSSIVWESKGARSLFGREGMSGLANVDMTPELATKVAMAYGTSLRKGDAVVTSRDSSRSARMLKRAIMAGLNASGVHVLDLEVASLPVTRFFVRSLQPAGGLSVRLVDGDPQSVTIRFFDARGADVSEEEQRRIERLLHREDYRRVLPEEIGDITYPPRALEDYAVALESTVAVEEIAARRFKVVIDYAYGATSLVMPNVLAKLGADVLAVNPYASTAGMLAFDPAAAAERVASLVVASGAHLGAVLDPGGERIVLIDDEGHVLSHVEAALAMVELVGDHLLGDTVAAPVNMTSHVERLAARHHVHVRPTKLTGQAIAAASTEPGVGLALDGRGGFILPGFLPAFDGAAAFVKVLDLLARTGHRLSSLVASLPRVHLAHETIVTPWERKGLVMRSLVDLAEGDVLLVDGVKVFHDGGWALARPDPEEPVTHVWAEAASDSDARRLAQEYVRRIRQMVR